jgi:prepilin-type N-terminal cleavage/methylation domain-containing protein
MRRCSLMKISSSARGFTLVELLVVIGIILLLISMLLPSMARARRQAESVQCMSNLRQLGILSQMYAMDTGGWIVATRCEPVYNGSYPVWDDLLRIHGQYTSADKIFMCPAQQYYDSTSGSGPYNRSYSENSDLAEQKWMKFDWVRNPGQVAFLIDSGLGMFNGYGFSVIKDQYIDIPNWPRYQVIFGAHPLGAPNILFTDFHVERYSPRYADLVGNSQLWSPQWKSFIKNPSAVNDPQFMQ